MARTRSPLDQRGEASQVTELLKHEPAGWRRERLLAIRHALENQLSTAEISQAIGRSESTLYNWLTLFRKGGLSDLLKKSSGKGRAPALNEEQMEAFRVELAKGKWRTGGQAYAWLKEQFNVTFHPNNIYVYLGKLGGRLKVPRPSHLKKCPQKVANFKDQLTQKLINLRLDPKRPLRLWVYDEMRYGLAPITRRMWTTKGTEIIAPVHKRYQWGYLFGAFQVGGAGAEFLFSPHVNKEADLTFLQQISQRDPYAQHVIIGDGAGFHHKEGQERPEQIPNNIHLLTLPPYSPELNPMEQVWDQIKDGICTKNYKTLEEMEEAITREINRFWEDVRKVFSQIGSGYLLSKLNAISKSSITPV